MSSQTKDLSQSELAVLESLQGTTEAVSQRDLARRTGFSVGLINAVIRKLVHTGYIKTSHLDRRSVEYLLTPQGFAQAAMKSYKYIIRTLREYRGIKTKLDEIVTGLKSEGFTEFFLHGDGELAEVVTLFFEEEGAGTLHRGMIPKALVKNPKLAVLNTEPKPFKAGNHRIVELVPAFANGKHRPPRSRVPNHPACRQAGESRAPKRAKPVDTTKALNEFYKTQ